MIEFVICYLLAALLFYANLYFFSQKRISYLVDMTITTIMSISCLGLCIYGFVQLVQYLIR